MDFNFLELTPLGLEKFKITYQKAVAAKKETLIFRGIEMATEYAGFLIRYYEKTIKK